MALRVIGFESRRATEMAELVRRHGGEPWIAPSMREIPLAEQPAAHDFARRLAAGTIDVLLLLTGVGTRTLAAAVEPVLPRERLVAALGTIALVTRGPKPVAALRELGLTPTLTVPEPNTWREVLATLDRALPVAGKRLAVQEYGEANPELLAGLAARGAEVVRVPVYRWALPEDVAPLRAAIARVVTGEAEVALFTSATQVTHVRRVADERGVAGRLAPALARMVVGSVGPVCSAALRAAGLPVDCEPSHPKMGPLVAETLRAAPAILAARGR